MVLLLCLLGKQSAILVGSEVPVTYLVPIPLQIGKEEPCKLGSEEHPTTLCSSALINKISLGKFAFILYLNCPSYDCFLGIASFLSFLCISL